MGSSGSGSLSDYSEKKPAGTNSNSGGSGKTDPCKSGFATSLEDVSRCEFYKTKGLPVPNTDVDITFNKVRLAAVETSSGLEIGYLSTKFNYLKNCIDNGFRYHGVVRTNSVSPTPSVLVDIVPV
jgi:hypothetical protein